MLSHVVLFTLNDPAEAPEAVERLRAMSGRIPAMKSIRCGINSREGANAKHLALITQHDSAEALAEYVAHPVHQELIEWLSPKVVERCVVDCDDFR